MSEKSIFASEIHKRAVKKFPRRRVIVHGIDDVWAIDLASMESLISYNDGYKYILCIIDVFSKYAWAVPLKNKTAATVLEAIKEVVKKSKRICQKIWVDQGSEFYNKYFQAWIKEHNITMYSTHGDSKSVVVERWIKTLKDIATKYFTEHSTRDWVHNLDKFLKIYNTREHRTIKMTPTEASNPENEDIVISYLYNKEPEKIMKPKFCEGDKVRISRIKDKFDKGYEPNYSYEVFTVSKVLPTQPVTYKLTDYSGELIAGSFYEQEMVKTEVPDYYEVEKVLKTRKVGKKTESFVKFVGWPAKFNLWLTEDQMYDIKK